MIWCGGFINDKNINKENLAKSSDSRNFIKETKKQGIHFANTSENNIFGAVDLLMTEIWTKKIQATSSESRSMIKETKKQEIHVANTSENNK